jgi:hypothetical protein
LEEILGALPGQGRNELEVLRLTIKDCGWLARVEMKDDGTYEGQVYGPPEGPNEKRMGIGWGKDNTSAEAAMLEAFRNAKKYKFS